MSRDNLETSGDESAIELKIWAKPVLRNVKSALSVDVRHPKTPLLKFPI